MFGKFVFDTKVNNKIKLIILAEILLLIFSVVFLTVYESQTTNFGEIINVAGKNRYLTESVILELEKYRIGGSDIGNPILELGKIRKNISLLKSEIPQYMDSKSFNEIFESKWNVVDKEYILFSAHANSIIEKRDAGLEITENDFFKLDQDKSYLLEATNDLVSFLSSYSRDRSLTLINSQIVLAVVNIITHIVLIFLIIRLLNSEHKKSLELALELEHELEKSKSLKKIQKINKELSNFKIALDNSASVAKTNSEGIITYANEMFCKLSQYSQEELIGKTHRIIKSGHHTEEFYENMWNTIVSGKIWQGNIKNKAKDGTFYWVRTVIVPTFDEERRITEYIAIRTDITPQIELSEKLIKSEKLSSIGQFASRMSHDIRNPLSIIRTSLENMKTMYGVDEIKQKQFERIDRSIDRISHQVDDVLDFVREKPLELNKTHMSEIIKESLDSLVIPDDVKLIFPKNDVEILCDKEQFSTALNNLILNGIQAINGKGTIEITCDENKDAVIIQIKDSGKGISKENLNLVFEPLFTTKQQGTGLGLAGVKSIIEAHGGVIYVTSPPTSFTITLPKTQV